MLEDGRGEQANRVTQELVHVLGGVVLVLCLDLDRDQPSGHWLVRRPHDQPLEPHVQRHRHGNSIRGEGLREVSRPLPPVLGQIEHVNGFDARQKLGPVPRASLLLDVAPALRGLLKVGGWWLPLECRGAIWPCGRDRFPIRLVGFLVLGSWCLHQRAVQWHPLLDLARQFRHRPPADLGDQGAHTMCVARDGVALNLKLRDDVEALEPQVQLVILSDVVVHALQQFDPQRGRHVLRVLRVRNQLEDSIKQHAARLATRCQEGAHRTGQRIPLLERLDEGGALCHFGLRELRCEHMVKVRPDRLGAEGLDGVRLEVVDSMFDC
mmetsp:Transcript_29108/g.94935  ORF Transcript_29108/g.94935 Transcript_29108/m.94935 type:complete len:323 (-) Transcript_29108:694-1662(-)